MYLIITLNYYAKICRHSQTFYLAYIFTKNDQEDDFENYETIDWSNNDREIEDIDCIYEKD